MRQRNMFIITYIVAFVIIRFECHYMGQTSHLEWKLWGNWYNQFVIYRWCHYVEKTWIGKVGERSVIKGDKRECKIWSSVPWTGGIIIKPNLALFNGIWNKLQLRGVIYVIGILYSWGKGRGIGGVGITAEGEPLKVRMGKLDRKVGLYRI